LAMVKNGNFSDLAAMDTEFVNYTKLVLDVYGIKTCTFYLPSITSKLSKNSKCCEF